MITLATLPHATAQEVFDQVRDHLLQQNEKSEKFLLDNNSPTCAYRGDDNRMCAAGCLIGDDEYNPSMEGNLYTDLPQTPAEHKELINALQGVHDEWDVDQWEDELKHTAIRNNLIWK